MVHNQDKNSEDLLVGVCCRSPNPFFSDRENDRFLCDMIKEVQGIPVLLIGDFNYPDIDWLWVHKNLSFSLSLQPTASKTYASREDLLLSFRPSCRAPDRAVLWHGQCGFTCQLTTELN